MKKGGQILRNAISLSCITKIPVRIYNIRANRPKPGLSAQHLEGIKGCQVICNAKVKGLELSSPLVEFIPRKISGGDFNITCQTAGSIALIVQVILPVLLKATVQSKVVLKGGTNVSFSPPIDHQKIILRTYLEKFGLQFDLDIVKRGFYPLGGGIVNLKVHPNLNTIQSVNFTEFGEINKVSGYCMISGNVPLKVLNNMKNEIIKNFKLQLNNVTCHITEIVIDKLESSNNFSHYQLMIHSTNGYILSAGQIIKPGVNVSVQILSDIHYLLEMAKNGICVDRNMQDQLIIFMALAEGKSAIQTVPISNHTKSAIFVCEKFLKKKFDIIEDENVATIICSDLSRKRPPENPLDL